jgi:hypothetical protein
MDNEVIIGNKSIEIYEDIILKKMNPMIYDDYGKSIILSLQESKIDFAETLIRRFRYAGLVEIERKRVKQATDSGSLRMVWKIRLEKIPILKDFSPTIEELEKEREEAIKKDE